MDAGIQTLRIFESALKFASRLHNFKFGTWETWKPKMNGNKAQVFC